VSCDPSLSVNDRLVVAGGVTFSYSTSRLVGRRSASVSAYAGTASGSGGMPNESARPTIVSTRAARRDTANISKSMPRSRAWLRSSTRTLIPLESRNLMSVRSNPGVARPDTPTCAIATSRSRDLVAKSSSPWRTRIACPGAPESPHPDQPQHNRAISVRPPHLPAARESPLPLVVEGSPVARTCVVGVMTARVLLGMPRDWVHRRHGGSRIESGVTGGCAW
jgi:hypothetical protein